MIIDFAHFTPYASLFGGVLIGLAAFILLAFNGRVMGISGIFALALTNHPFSGLWRWFFLAGTVIGPLIYLGFREDGLLMRPVSEGAMLYVGGFIVGLGSMIGAGCTSGHGICGLARLSPRSFIAVMTFMVSAVVTVLIVHSGS
jgi:uncharacterized membrane protein YedE/YeeE